ncbi:alginate export family protein [Luteolibacter ambystomatis]|uniref:Alginate export family protein n=2 Tax=Luteolibacter ambystomatis TaxID=2824561 RepID=A0A975J2L0_9BACT|nr:alginate export family protein [Luteolibacter ambystomatis]QUE52859.1 alginate export family protein [Luteolibacter ambystomatis]
MKTPDRNAAPRRSVNGRSATRSQASRLAITTLRIPRHLASAAMLTALAGVAHAGTAPAPATGASDCLLNDFKFDAEVRVRAEWTDNVRDFNDDLNAADDDGWLITRTRLGLAYQPASWLKLYAQGQDSREFFSGRPHDTLNGANGDDTFDLRQLYLQLGDLKDIPLQLTLGRQPLDFGSRRILADSNWSNYGRTFDAARVTWKVNKDWQIDAFAGHVVVIEEDQFNDSDHNADLIGLYASGKIPCGQTLDFYAIHLDSEHSTVAPVKGDFWTFGSRLFKKAGKDSPWDWELEAAFQTGHVLSGAKELDLLSFGGQATLGYTFNDAPWTPRLSVNYSYASGDDDRTDGDQHRFLPVYPSTHNMNGLLDSVGWANIHDPYVELTVTPAKDWKVGLQAHAFFRAETADFVYRANGSSTLRTPAGYNGDRFIGTEVDLYVQTNLTKNLELLSGTGALFAGDYLDSTGTDDTARTAYLQLTYKY